MITIQDVVQLMKEAGIARGIADTLAPDRSLDGQGLDSYDRMSLLTELEDRFHVDLPNDVARKLKSLNDIVAHLNSNQPEA